MTREEEMWKSVEEEHGELSRREALIALTAMEWADKTMIDKVCKWFKDNIEEFVHGRDWELDKDDLTACLRVEIMINDDHEPSESLLDGDFSCETTEDLYEPSDDELLYPSRHYQYFTEEEL